MDNTLILLLADPWGGNIFKISKSQISNGKLKMSYTLL